MSHWNHRVIKQVIHGVDFFSVHEVFYNDDDSIRFYTEDPINISGDSVLGLKKYTQWILTCLDKDVLIKDDIVCKG